MTQYYTPTKLDQFFEYAVLKPQKVSGYDCLDLHVGAVINPDTQTKDVFSVLYEISRQNDGIPIRHQLFSGVMTTLQYNPEMDVDAAIRKGYEYAIKTLEKRPFIVDGKEIPLIDEKGGCRHRIAKKIDKILSGKNIFENFKEIGRTICYGIKKRVAQTPAMRSHVKPHGFNR